MPTQSCPPERLQSIAISTSVCVCLSARISPERHAILPMAVARSSPSKATKSQGDGATLGGFFPVENALYCIGRKAWEGFYTVGEVWYLRLLSCDLVFYHGETLSRRQIYTWIQSEFFIADKINMIPVINEQTLHNMTMWMTKCNWKLNSASSKNCRQFSAAFNYGNEVVVCRWGQGRTNPFVVWSVCWMSCAKMAEPIEMPFGVLNFVGPHSD